MGNANANQDARFALGDFDTITTTRYSYVLSSQSRTNICDRLQRTLLWRSDMTEEQFRSIALSLPETSESAHMCHPDFRVGGKIFATLWPAAGWAMVKLTPEQQAQLRELRQPQRPRGPMQPSGQPPPR